MIMRCSRRPRQGLSLIEILIVLTIVAILLQLLLPTVHRVRESARRLACLQQIRQLAVAVHLHESASGHFPSGGWNWRWVGDGQRGSGRRQPGGWIFAIHPYAETSGNAATISSDPATSRAQRTLLQSHVVAGLMCPSRRDARSYPVASLSTWADMRNVDPPQALAKTDYAANGGDRYVNLGEGPRTLAEYDSGRYEWPSYLRNASGVIFAGSHLRIGHIVDGTSHTYLVGEKSLSPRHYFDSEDPGDDGSIMQGDDMDITRWTCPTISDAFYRIDRQLNRPQHDHPGQRHSYAFGSPHPAGWNVAFCDGSARLMSFDLDAELHRAHGNRHDQRVTTHSAP